MMTEEALSPRELVIAWKAWFSSENHDPDLRIDSMAEIEMVLLLKAGIELSIYSDSAADFVFELRRERITKALEMVMSRFPAEISIFADGVRKGDNLSRVSYTEPLNPELLNTRSVEMLFHEICRFAVDRRATSFTRLITFSTDNEWNTLLSTVPSAEIFDAPTENEVHDTAALGSPHEPVGSIYRNYFVAMNHMSAMKDIFAACSAEAANQFSALQLRRRIRAIHNWRINLKDAQIQYRFRIITKRLASAVVKEMPELNYWTFIQRVEELCSDWSSDDFIIEPRWKAAVG